MKNILQRNTKYTNLLRSHTPWGTSEEKKILKCQVNKLINERIGSASFTVPDDPIKAAIVLGKRFKGERRRQLIEAILKQPD